MKKATRPLEYLCFFPAEFPTRDDGDVAHKGKGVSKFEG